MIPLSSDKVAQAFLFATQAALSPTPNFTRERMYSFKSFLPFSDVVEVVVLMKSPRQRITEAHLRQSQAQGRNGAQASLGELKQSVLEGCCWLELTTHRER